MHFYQSCLGGDLILTRLADTPMKTQFPPEQHHKITYALLKSGVVEFSATDWCHPVHQRQQGNTTAMYVTGDNFDELSPIFQKLREGADEDFLVELQEMPFGVYGRFTDPVWSGMVLSRRRGKLLTCPCGRRNIVRKLKIIEHISLDSVTQAPGAPDEDGDYPYGG